MLTTFPRNRECGVMKLVEKPGVIRKRCQKFEHKEQEAHQTGWDDFPNGKKRP